MPAAPALGWGHRRRSRRRRTGAFELAPSWLHLHQLPWQASQIENQRHGCAAEAMAAGSDEPKCKDVEAGSGGSGGGGSGGSSPPRMQRELSRAHFWEEDVFPQLPEAPQDCK